MNSDSRLLKFFEKIHKICFRKSVQKKLASREYLCLIEMYFRVNLLIRNLHEIKHFCINFTSLCIIFTLDSLSTSYFKTGIIKLSNCFNDYNYNYNYNKYNKK